MATRRIRSAPATWQALYGPNLGWALELYEQYLRDPQSVDDETRALFERLGPPPAGLGGQPSASAVQVSSAPAPAEADVQRIVAAQRLARNIRMYGHLEAHINPIGQPPAPAAILNLDHYGLTEADLARIPAHWVWAHAPADVRDAGTALARLRRLYTGSLAYEFAHVHNPEEHAWLTRRVESSEWPRPLPADQAKALLRRLIEVDEFEKFLHRTFVGQKRFSIEGVDMLVPMLDRLIYLSVQSGARDIMIGMAHRGRLNVLAHVLGKPYQAIFSEFHAAPNKELVPSEGSMGINYGWTGDVKYHLGASREVAEGQAVQARLRLANNPSHLEFVNPVVEGFARAAQEDRSAAGAPRQDMDAAVAVLVHGDAAFLGEGIVAETLNLSQIPGYATGGTIHIIANNQLGFTAIPEEGRSTRYASDLAKGFEIPIVHVNADDPEACLAALELAHAWRDAFHKDFLIDLVGYRRWGHNEGDDPVMTQPRMYDVIAHHPTVRELYAKRLVEAGVVQPDEVARMEAEVRERLREAYSQVGAHEKEAEPTWKHTGEMRQVTAGPVTREALEAYNEAMLERPEGFTVYPKLERILQRRRAAFTDANGRVDWAHAEALAFASIIAEGTPIRLTGQDSERGTFSQRHLVLHDHRTGQTYTPLQHLPQARASFAVHNSPLTEAAVIGFEYGYNVEAPQTLVLWEAQFGDFANAGQVLIDQFLSAGLAKWGQPSGLVLLLPHGYEGQGPEHSSARLERYLQLSAEHNWRVVYPTTAAQYFHLLRDQAARLTVDPRPLVVMTPKSLLRNPRAASTVDELAGGAFRPVWSDANTDRPQKAVRRLVLCTGKVGVDLAAALEQAGGQPEWLAVARIEQLYPFPADALRRFAEGFTNLSELVWLQEEPENMGAWGYIRPHLMALFPKVPIRYVGRPERSSPAEGLADAHDVMQRQIINQALSEQGLLVHAGRESR
ncbi:MAG: 2-oxoglutarate dehydrogenase E1 component [Alicyclobacillus sp.]|nr:2-oxoglutarate dehydrogenase E1 component [Alicyclobacillus sp.]